MNAATTEIQYNNLVFKPVMHKGKAIKIKIEINGKAQDLTRFNLTNHGVPAKDLDVLFFDLCRMVGKDVPGAATNAAPAKVVKSSLNPDWVRHNNVHNEGGEGYNPYNKYN